MNDGNDQQTKKIIAAAIEVHRHLGPGLLESIYEAALCHELDLRQISYERQKHVDVIYKDKIIKGQRIDLLVFGSMVRGAQRLAAAPARRKSKGAKGPCRRLEGRPQAP